MRLRIRLADACAGKCAVLHACLRECGGQTIAPLSLRAMSALLSGLPGGL